MEPLPLLAHGANESPTSIQDIKAHQILDTAMALPALIDKRSTYTLPHVNQNTVGICTAADLVDMAQAHFGKVFSMKFQYVGQKQKYDGDMLEGSSNLSALKFGKNFGFLPSEFDLEGNDTSVPYQDFINVAYTAAQFEEAAKYRISAYAVVPLDPVGFATALNGSQYGLMTRMAVGDNFYAHNHIITWDKASLELLEAPNPITGGHSIKVTYLERLDVNQIRETRNSWGGVGNTTTSSGLIWCGDGNIKYSYFTQSSYVTEAHVPVFGEVIFKHKFIIPIKMGDQNEEVVALQRVLVQTGFLKMPQGVSMGYYGPITVKAVFAFQLANGITTGDGENVGPATRAALNASQG